MIAKPVRQALFVLALVLSRILVSAQSLPEIVVQPVSRILAEGLPLNLSVQATGENLSYQWRLNGVNIPGANQANYNIPIFSYLHGGRYDVIVSTPLGAVISAPARVTIPALPLQLSDNFASRIIPLLSSLAVGQGTGSNAGGTKDQNEPDHADKPGGKSVWYVWKAPANGIVTFSTAGSDFDTLLGVYTGNTPATLTPVASDDDSGGYHTSKVQFNVVGGTSYSIAIDGLSGTTGTFVLTWQLEIILGLTDRLPVVTRKPRGVVGLEKKPAALSLELQNPVDTVQWFLNGQSVAGGPTFSTDSLEVPQVGSYQAQVRRGNRTILLEPVDLQINLKDQGALRNLLAYDKFAEAFFAEKPPISELTPFGTSRSYSGTQIFSTQNATTDPDEPLICGTGGGASEWYSYTAEANAILRVDTDGSNFDTVLGVYVDNGQGTGFYDSLQQVACDNNTGADGQDSMVMFQVTKNVTYYIAVDGVNGAKGQVTLHYYLGQPPTFQVQPPNLSVAQGSEFTLSPDLGGTEPVSYQWRWGRFDLSGEKGATLRRTNITSSHAGTYSLLAWNPLGTNRSQNASITVLGPPIISDVLDQVVAEDAPSQGLNFSVSDSDTPISSVVVTAASSNAGLLPTGSLAVTGNGNSRTLNYQPIANQHGATVITLTASDGVNTSTRFFQITVSPVNDAPIAAAQNLALNEDGSIALQLNGSDVEGTPLVFSVETPPQHGALSGSLPNLVYTPEPNFTGEDSFTFRASDGQLTSASALVRLQVNPINDAPQAHAQAIELAEDTPKTILLSGSDVEGSALSHVLDTLPTKGTLSGSVPNLLYTPNPDTHGSDSFTFHVTDGELTSSSQPISITISAINDPPVANPQSVRTSEDTAVPIELGGSDTEGSALTFAIDAPPTKGVISGTAPNLIYTPNPHANGADFFTFQVHDGELNSTTATVTIDVTAINDAPTAQPQSLTLLEDNPLLISLTGTDHEGTALTFEIVTGPSNGKLMGNLPTLRFVPNPNVFGSDSFTFRVTDGELTSAPASILLTIDAVNDAPSAIAQTLSLNEDTPRTLILSGTDIEGSVLTYALLSEPAKGQLSGTPPNLTFTPNPNANGTDTFDFEVSDGDLTSAAATISFIINPINDAPLAHAQSTTIIEDTSTPITLAASDPEGSVLSFTVIAGPTKGTLSGAPPNLVFTPHLNATGSDSFTFRVHDGLLNSGIVKVHIAITPVNDPPVANTQMVLLNEDTITTILLTGHDVEGTGLLYSILTQPHKGRLSGTAPNLKYTPDRNVTGADSFTFSVSDGQLQSTIETITLNIAPINDAPVSFSQALSLPEDSPRGIILSGVDLEGDSLTFTVLTPPSKGQLAGSPPNLTYTPNLNFSGLDSFTFGISDGSLTSSAAAINLTINPVNDPPVANTQSVSLTEDRAKSIVLTGSDPEKSALSYTVIAGPAKGSLSGNAPNLVFTPHRNATGTDSFAFRVNDGFLNSGIVKVLLTINPVNDVPVANARTISVNEDTLTSVLLTGSDVEGAALLYSIITYPTRGTLSGTTPNLKYTPDRNFTGADSFTFRVSDGQLQSAIATVALNILPIDDDPPVSFGQALSLAEDTPKPIVLTGLDYEGNALTFTILRLPAKGQISGTPPNLTYTPNLHVSGTDSFTFEVSDGSLRSTAATITLTINPVNDPPVANTQSVSLTEDRAKSIVLSGSDLEGSPLSYTVIAGPAKGSLSGTPPNLMFSPNLNATGADSFTFRVNDGLLNSGIVKVLLTINPVNDVPVANPRTVLVNEDTLTSILLTGSDVEGAALFYTVITHPTKGKLSGTAPNLKYTPDPNLTGTDFFTFRVSDGQLQSAIAAVTLVILPMDDDPPVAFAQALSLDEDIPKPIVLSGNDFEGSALTFAVLTQPAKGRLSGTPPNLIYTPNLNVSGTDSFTFKVNDGSLDSTAAAVSLTINPVNDPPAANPQSVSVTEDRAKAVVLTGSDIEGSALSYTVMSGPTKGALSGTAPHLTFTPNPNATGADSFTFRVNDGSHNSGIVKVTLTINPVNDVPVAHAQTVDVNPNTLTPVVLTGSDVEGAPLIFTVLTQPAFGTLSGTVPNLKYTPHPNVTGTDSFDFRVSDGQVQSLIVTVTLNLLPTDDAPLVSAPSVSSADAPSPSGSPTGGAFRFQEIMVIHDQVLLQVSAHPGAALILEASRDFVTWQTLKIFLATGGTDRLSAPFEARPGAQFFRLRTEEP